MPRVKQELAANPIRVAREEIGKTLQEFAALCKIHYQALFLSENGVYPGVLPSIRKYLTNNLDFDGEVLDREYKEFVRLRRVQFERNYGTWTLPEPYLGDSPVVVWREALGLSRLALAKELCVQPSLLYRVEMGKTPTLPTQFKEALLEINFPKRLVEEIEERVEEFYLFRQFKSR